MPFPYKPRQSIIPYGLHVPYDQGYDARSRASAPKAEDHGASAYFQAPDGSQVALWVTDIQADFAVSGQTGQSRMLREFFPHSFNDVTLQIVGNVASTQEYNRLALFIREHQWRALQAINGGSSATQTITFGLLNTYEGQTPYSGRNVKGPHRPWTVQGYVKKSAAGAKRWETAPEFSIAFIVTESLFNGNTGLWSDEADSGSVLKSWLQLLSLVNGNSRVQGSGFVQDPVDPPTPPSPSHATTPTKPPVSQNNPLINSSARNTLTWSTSAASIFTP